MYIRMGPKNKELTSSDGEKKHLHLDGVLLWSRSAVNDHIRQLEQIRDALWPLAPEEENKK